MTSLTAWIDRPALVSRNSTATGFPKRGGHVPALDALRGLAILWVLVYHFDLKQNDLSWLGRFFGGLFRLGGCGVDLFFVLSGFLITGILFDAKESPSYFRDFYIRRGLRIFPLYYGALIAAFLLLPLALPTSSSLTDGAAPYQSWLWLYMSNVLIGLKGTYVLGYFSHFWSLAVEEHFYLVWPFVIFFCDRKQAMTACLACVVGALACRLLLVASGDEYALAAYVLTPCRMDALAAGGWLALAIRGPARFEAWKAGTWWSALGCAAVSGLLWFWKRDLGKMDGCVLALRFSLTSWLFATLLLHTLTARPGGMMARFWEGRFLRFFGKYSYGLYVFHYPLTPVFRFLFPIEVLNRWAGSEFLGQLAYSTLATGTTLGLALVSWNLYEQHFLSLKNAWTGRGRSRAGSALDVKAVPS